MNLNYTDLSISKSELHREIQKTTKAPYLLFMNEQIVDSSGNIVNLFVNQSEIRYECHLEVVLLHELEFKRYQKQNLFKGVLMGFFGHVIAYLFVKDPFQKVGVFVGILINCVWTLTVP
ncbi:hypothetical protein EDD86DRAFT_245868 [Gorgonomyces haynaldii]|nr:hypothetical protein EDD86DRAFT_245868 [Gorgonomyces haynaldii]